MLAGCWERRESDEKEHILGFIGIADGLISGFAGAAEMLQVEDLGVTIPGYGEDDVHAACGVADETAFHGGEPGPL